MKVSEFVPYIVAVLAAFLIFFYWVYDAASHAFSRPSSKLALFPAGRRGIGSNRRAAADDVNAAATHGGASPG